MIKRLVIFAAALAAFATPAFAANNTNFTGVRAELTAGADDVRGVRDTSDINYGAAVGVDVPVGTNLTLGVEGTAGNIFERDRLLGVGARLGVAVSPRALLYAGAGYENYRLARNFELDGLRLNAGAEFAIGKVTYLKIEGRYSDLDADTGRIGGLVGVGLRF